MRAIGGYIELELPIGQEYHADSIKLNTARNAFEYILKAKKYKKVYLPYFTCDAMLEPVIKNDIIYEFYHIDENLEPLFDYSQLESNATLLYTNYFGLKDKFLEKLKFRCTNLIIDNAQSFYSQPLTGIDTIYSPRKFFGLPDGAYLFTDKKSEDILEVDKSYTRFNHLLKRIDLSAEEGYLDFCSNDISLENNSIKLMSKLTIKLLSSINYEEIAKIRKENFNYLHVSLGNINRLKFDIGDFSVPMVYPFWGTKELRLKLLQNKIYTATYWPNIREWCKKDDLEFQMMDEIIHLPIDQRYRKEDMDIILKYII